jgi:hypothetical protein
LIQHTISTTFTSMKMYFNEIYLFQNSPVQPLLAGSSKRGIATSNLSSSITC